MSVGALDVERYSIGGFGLDLDLGCGAYQLVLSYVKCSKWHTGRSVVEVLVEELSVDTLAKVFRG